MNDLFQASQLRDRGIKASKENADDKHTEWSEKAYIFLRQFIEDSNGDPFMAEDVRMSPLCHLPQPPSKRAWGAILVRAAREGLIIRVGFKETKNPWAHRTPATLWCAK